jgi:hypothetical protein
MSQLQSKFDQINIGKIFEQNNSHQERNIDPGISKEPGIDYSNDIGIQRNTPDLTNDHGINKDRNHIPKPVPALDKKFNIPNPGKAYKEDMANQLNPKKNPLQKVRGIRR